MTVYSCGHVTEGMCEPCRQYAWDKQAIPKQYNPSRLSEANEQAQKRINDFLNPKPTGAVWQCPGCLTYYGPTIGFCQCESKKLEAK